MLNDILNLEGVAVLNKKQQEGINGGLGGFFKCKDGSRGDKETGNYEALRRAAESTCANKGGVAYTMYFEEPTFSFPPLL